jgi:hypothetical protein
MGITITALAEDISTGLILTMGPIGIMVLRHRETIFLSLLVCACFWGYRICSPNAVQRVQGWYDWESELAHQIPFIVMASGFGPINLHLPSNIWFAVLSVCTMRFLIRALTYGRKLPYNVWWWDWGHVGMFVFMGVDYLPFKLPTLLSYPISSMRMIFWIWIISLNLRELYNDVKKAPKILFFGDDLSHIYMGVVNMLMLLPGVHAICLAV